MAHLDLDLLQRVGIAVPVSVAAAAGRRAVAVLRIPGMDLQEQLSD
jgi:hypothetical protein